MVPGLARLIGALMPSGVPGTDLANALGYVGWSGRPLARAVPARPGRLMADVRHASSVALAA